VDEFRRVAIRRVTRDGVIGEDGGMDRLAGKVAIVTGGGKGIGVTYTQALVAAGAAVAIADIVDSQAVAAEIRAQSPQARVIDVPTDVSNEKSVAALVARVLKEFGQIDILVNNAAVFATLPPADVVSIDVDLWDRVMAVNVRGPFLLSKHVAPHMISRGTGKIINVTSGVSNKGLPGMTHYATSKGAITTFTRSLSRELGAHGICVNSLAPGAIMSDTIAQNDEHMAKYHAHALGGRAIKREGYPRDLVGALVFLASADSDFITGQTIVVDGGSVNT